MSLNTIEVTSEELETSTLITLHARGAITANELRRKLDLAIMGLGMNVDWWEETVADVR